MKKILSLILASSAVVLAASCGKLIQGEEKAVLSSTEPCSFSVGVTVEGAGATRADAFTDAQAYEEAVNGVQYLIFGADGLEKYEAVFTKDPKDFTLKSGDKTVYAVANGPDLKSITSESALLSQMFCLSDESRDASKGFQMMGKASVTVGKSTPATTVRVRRVAARITLKSVTNNLSASYSALTIERVWLSNVKGDWNSNASGLSLWHNRQGRSDDNEANIIDGSAHKAEVENMTYSAVGQSVAKGTPYQPSSPVMLYCYPNSSTVTPDGWKTWTDEGQRTILVIEASVDGTKCYYPVVLSGVERNSAYTIYATISNVGSDDPNDPIDKTAAEISVSVDPWEDGGVLSPDM